MPDGAVTADAMSGSVRSLRVQESLDLRGFGGLLRECAGCGGDRPGRRVEESEHTATHQEIDMFKQQQNEHRQQLTLGCALMTTAVLAALALGTGAGPAAARQDAEPTAGRLSARELLATSVPNSDGDGGLATDLAYQAFRSGERAAFGRVGDSANEAFRSGERATFGQNS